MEIGFLCHGEFETLKWAYVELLGTAPSMSQIDFPLRNLVAYLSMWNQIFKNKITDNGEMFKIFDFWEGCIYTKHLHTVPLRIYHKSFLQSITKTRYDFTNVTALRVIVKSAKK